MRVFGKGRKGRKRRRQDRWLRKRQAETDIDMEFWRRRIGPSRLVILDLLVMLIKGAVGWIKRLKK
jgi:hypothetical protein